MAVAIKVRRADKYPRPRRMIRTIVAGKMNVVVHVPNNCSPIARVVQEVIGVTVVIKVELTTSADTRRSSDCCLQSIDRTPLLAVHVSAGDLVCPKLLLRFRLRGHRQWQPLLSICQGSSYEE
jgi:hypothetical protein